MPAGCGLQSGSAEKHSRAADVAATSAGSSTRPASPVAAGVRPLKVSGVILMFGQTHSS